MTDLSHLSQGARFSLNQTIKDPTPERIAELERKYPDAYVVFLTLPQSPAKKK